MEFAEKLAREAGKLAFELRWNSDLVISAKEDNSKVTNADYLVEQGVIDQIQNRFPEHRIRGEEHGTINGRSGSSFCWAIDAIDGTSAYINHEINCVVNIALFEDRQVLLSAIYNPFTNELFSTSGEGVSRLNGKQLPLVTKSSIADSTLNYQLSRAKADDIHCLVSLWKDRKIAKVVEAGGSPAYNLACVARGSYDFFVMHCSRAANPEDYCGAVSIVRNAGGIVTDLDGHSIDCLTHQGYFVAGIDPARHDAFLDTLRLSGFGVEKKRPRVVFLAGLYGTGKSTFAGRLAEKLGYRNFNADDMRRQLNMGSYDEKDGDVVWGTLFWKAGKELDNGGSIVLESLFLNEAQRKPDFDFVRSKNADGMFVEIVCPESVAKKRISARPASRNGRHVPTNRADHYDQKKDLWEPIIPGLQVADRGFISYLIFDSQANKLYAAYLRSRHEEWANEIAAALGVDLSPAPTSLVEAEKRYAYLPS